MALFSVASPRLQAGDAPALIKDAEISRLGGLLANEAIDSGMLDGVCRLYLADREGVMDALVAAQSFAALSDVISDELNALKPGSDCEVMIMKTTGQLSRDQISTYLQTTSRPGAVFALVFFPSRLGVMMFANGYRDDGRSAIFTDRIDVAVETANQPESSESEGLGGPALPVVRPQNQADDPSQGPSNEGLDNNIQLESSEKSFLDRLRENAGTERAE